MNWDDLRFLLAVHRHESHARAARALSVDATTIGRKIRALERSLGVKLVRRVRGGYALTPAALGVMPALERMDRDAAAVERAAQSANARLEGTVRLTAGEGLMNYVVVPALPGLRARHPEIEINLVGDSRVLDLSRREADVAVRLVRPSSPALVARRLPPLSLGLFVSDGYLASRRAPSSVRALASHTFLDVVDPKIGAPHRAWLEAHVPETRVAIRGAGTGTIVEACAAGLGIAVLYAPIGRARGLTRLLPEIVFHRDAWVVYHQDDRASARVRAVATWLAETFAA